LDSAYLLEEGAWMIRLRSRLQQGCDSFKECGKGADWYSRDSKQRRKNHWSFYCDIENIPMKNQHVAQCLADEDPNGSKFRCFTSEDSNWSLNAVLVKREVMMNSIASIKSNQQQGEMPHGTFAKYGLSTFDRQDGFESEMIQIDWGKYKVPMCMSVNGIFLHAELDG